MENCPLLQLRIWIVSCQLFVYYHYTSSLYIIIIQAHCILSLYSFYNCTSTCLPSVAFSVNEVCEYFVEATIKLTLTGGSIWMSQPWLGFGFGIGWINPDLDLNLGGSNPIWICIFNWMDHWSRIKPDFDLQLDGSSSKESDINSDVSVASKFCW